MFIAEEPELVEGGEDEMDPVLDRGGGLIFVTGEFAEAEVSVLHRDPRCMEEAKHERICSQGAL